MITSTPAARHARNSRGSVGAVFSALGVVLAVALVSATAIVGITAWSLTQRLHEGSVDIAGPSDPPLPPISAYEGSFNLLVVGKDDDPLQSTAIYGEREGTRNDVNILLHVAKDHKSAVAVSFPRDLIIPHPECTDPETGETFDSMAAQPVNVAFSRGGLGCVVDTIESLTGLDDINYAGVVKFDAVAEVTQAIGGVDVCLTSELYDENVIIVGPNGEPEHLDLPAGTHPISGQDAIGFLRSREAVGDGSDIGRISSQQQFLSSLVRKLKDDSTLTDLAKLYSLADIVSKNVTLSKSLDDIPTMISMAQALRTIDLDDIVFVQYPGIVHSLDDPDFPGKVTPDQDAADQLFALIKNDQPVKLGGDSQGVGTVADPVTPDVGASTPPEEPAPPADSEAPTGDAPPTQTGSSVLPDGVKGQTAQDQTCTVTNE